MYKFKNARFFLITLTIGSLFYIIYSTAQIQQNKDKAKDYYQMYMLCEQKYQEAAAGNVNTAIRINGQMDTLQHQIDQLDNKKP